MAGAGGWAGAGGHAGGHVRLLRLRNGVSAGEGRAMVEVRAGPRPSAVATPALPLPAPARARCPRPPRRGGHGAAQPPTGRVMSDLWASSSVPQSTSMFPYTLLPIASFHLSGPGPGVFMRINAFIFLVGSHLRKAWVSLYPVPTFSQGEPR